MNEATKSTSKAPPKWFAQLAWHVHRFAYRITRGRLGLWRWRPDRWGAMRLRTTGRRTGKERIAILSYFEDGPNVVTLAMNGWMKPEPKWWLNLQANPDAIVDLPDGQRAVRGRGASGEERERLWAMYRSVAANTGDIDEHAKLRPTETAIVVLEPRG